MQYILHNEVLVYGIIAILIFVVTQGLKWACIKPFTKKIKNERIRKAINTIIYFIPFALGMAFEFVYGVVLMKGEFCTICGIVHGSSGIALFGAFERVYSIATGNQSNNPYETTEEGRAVKELADAVVKDGKIDKNDKDAIKEFWDKVK